MVKKVDLRTIEGKEHAQQFKRSYVNQKGIVVYKPRVWIAVLGFDGLPLMPCSAKRARLLLERGRAKVIRYEPFTIQLLDRSRDNCLLQPVQIKIDPGSKTTGIAVVREDYPAEITVVRLIELQHRGQAIKRKLDQRRMYRRNRRSRKTRYRQHRFDNRTKPSGWLPPSIQHRVDSTLSWITRLRRWYPVTKIVYENVKFDTQLIDNPYISGLEYQQGTLLGYELREYLLLKFDHRCAYCGTDQVTRFELDHIVARSRGGSNRLSNIVPACGPCNQAKGSMDYRVFLQYDPVKIQQFEARLKKPMRDMATMNAIRNKLYQTLFSSHLPVGTGTGGQTKYNRIRLGIPKTHALDAVCVGHVNKIQDWARKTLQVKCIGRGRYRRAQIDRYGRVIAHVPRQKYFFGFRTGDIVKIKDRINPYSIKIGKISVRASGHFAFETNKYLCGVTHKRCIRVQHASGYEYKNT